MSSATGRGYTVWRVALRAPAHLEVVLKRLCLRDDVIREGLQVLQQLYVRAGRQVG